MSITKIGTKLGSTIGVCALKVWRISSFCEVLLKINQIQPLPNIAIPFCKNSSVKASNDPKFCNKHADSPSDFWEAVGEIEFQKKE